MTGPGGSEGSHLEARLRAGAFCVTAEVVPPRSADPAAVTRQAETLIGVADAVNVTDNPTARVHMSAVAGAALVAKAGLEPVLQMTCRDRNRMALSSDLLGAWALGARNLLCLGGDPAGVGDHPEAKTVFDLSVLDLIGLAAGLRDRGQLLSGERIEHPPAYLVGVADAPLIPGYDYGRLEAKADAGARFVQTQIVFDVDAFGEWAEGARQRGLLERLWVLAGIAVPRSARAARFMATLPGVIVPDEVFARLGAEDESATGERSADVGSAGIALAGDLISGIRRIEGLAGVHVMGLGHVERIREVLSWAGIQPETGSGVPGL